MCKTICETIKYEMKWNENHINCVHLNDNLVKNIRSTQNALKYNKQQAWEAEWNKVCSSGAATVTAPH